MRECALSPCLDFKPYCEASHGVRLRCRSEPGIYRLTYLAIYVNRKMYICIYTDTRKTCIYVCIYIFRDVSICIYTYTYIYRCMYISQKDPENPVASAIKAQFEAESFQVVPLPSGFIQPDCRDLNHFPCYGSHTPSKAIVSGAATILSLYLNASLSRPTCCISFPHLALAAPQPPSAPKATATSSEPDAFEFQDGHLTGESLPTLDSKTLQQGCRMMYAGFASSGGFWS